MLSDDEEEDKKTPAKRVVCINLLSDDEEEDKKTPATRVSTSEACMEDVEVVTPTEPKMERDVASASPTQADGVDVLGRANVLRLPHARQYCPDNIFVSDIDLTYRPSANCTKFKTEIESNEKHCDLCYCYVCDKPVAECTQWKLSETMCASDSAVSAVRSSMPHCLASDDGHTKDGHKWKQLRRNQNMNASNRPFDDDRCNGEDSCDSYDIHDGYGGYDSYGGCDSYDDDCSHGGCDPCICGCCHVGRNSSSSAFRGIKMLGARMFNSEYAFGKGPWPPTDEKAKKEVSLTQCRICNCKNFTTFAFCLKDLYVYIHPIWCESFCIVLLFHLIVVLFNSCVLFVLPIGTTDLRMPTTFTQIPQIARLLIETGAMLVDG